MGRILVTTVHKSNYRHHLELNHDLHAVDATPLDGVAMPFLPLDRARTAASSPSSS